MRRLLLLLLLLSGCAHDYFSGPMDLERIDKGEIYIDMTNLPGDRTMLRLVFAVDAPAWRLLNVLRDVEEMPVWEATLSRVKVLARQNDRMLVEFELKPILGHSVRSLREDVRIDPERNQASFTSFSNDWMREGQLVVKYEPMGDGSRTLVTLFFLGEVTLTGESALAYVFRGRYAQSARNLRHIVNLAQYGDRPATTQDHRSRVAVPVFAAEGVSQEVARTATRVFAEQLMHDGTWDVSTPQEVSALLSYNQKQMLMGCDGSAKCSADVGKALGADMLVTGTVGKLGDRFVVTASLSKIPEGTVERRASRDGAENALLDTIKSAASDLVRQ